MKTQAPPALRSLPDRALDAWLRANLEQSATLGQDQDLPPELVDLVRHASLN